MGYDIILFDNNRDYYDFEKWPMKEADIEQVLMFNPHISSIAVKILRNCPFTASLSLNDWYKKDKLFDIAIIPDATANINVLRTLAKKPKGKKQILYYRNRVHGDDIKKIEFASGHGFIVATYSKEDAAEFNLKFIPQCWNKKLISNHERMKIENDVYFVGEVKNRYKQIIDAKNQCEQAGLSVLFHIISKDNLPYTQSERVSYAQVIDNILSSKAVLDIVTEDNLGLTIRPLEALMSKKKVITNFADIKSYDFYDDNKNNIFIIGENDVNELKSFIDCPFEEGSGVVEMYDTESWMKKMILLSEDE